MRPSVQIAIDSRELGRYGAVEGRELAGERVHQAPEAMEEAAHPLDALIAPLEIALGRRGEEAEEARRVGTVALDQIVGVDHVALRLAHLGVVLDDHPLGEEVLERLAQRAIEKHTAIPTRNSTARAVEH